MLGPHCTENPPCLSSTCGSGNIHEIGGLKTYVTGNQDSKLAVILISDAFGSAIKGVSVAEFPIIPLKSSSTKLADKVEAYGFFVVVPDFLYGDPFSSEKPLDKWVQFHSPDKGCEDAMTIIAALRSKGVSKIGVAGLCWGGLVAVRLAKFDTIQAAVVLHPGSITVEEINEVKIPIAILGAEIDNYAPPELLKQLGDILAAKAHVDSFVKIFPGVEHGWTVRYNDDDEFAVKSAEESHLDMLNWLTKYIK